MICLPLVSFTSLWSVLKQSFADCFSLCKHLRLSFMNSLLLCASDCWYCSLQSWRQQNNENCFYKSHGFTQDWTASGNIAISSGRHGTPSSCRSQHGPCHAGRIHWLTENCSSVWDQPEISPKTSANTRSYFSKWKVDSDLSVEVTGWWLSGQQRPVCCQPQPLGTWAIHC